MNMLDVATSVQKDGSGAMSGPFLLGPGISRCRSPVWCMRLVTSQSMCLELKITRRERGEARGK